MPTKLKFFLNILLFFIKHKINISKDMNMYVIKMLIKIQINKILGILLTI